MIPFYGSDKEYASFIKGNKFSSETDKTINIGVFADDTSSFFAHNSIKIVWYIKQRTVL